ncbi:MULTISPECIES: organic hydroperoxide resistance protein [unclassified Sphingomonas]|uniref:organic hydroperoxide resistance protein n=1 Tax=unclassified Sphingomonas TaxID=196159 RepID=UPI0006F3A11A|nr:MULTISPECIES: organic hydroperoxide resistance protein [unclassified Sphingomonas]KQX25477.1 organic hydroperoxide resistance protein [Sphingomonas sp. Root1294]KQY66469.1 organic hydroperoxide resistance protein [Sphingomonas sp. Root50]KRB90213.1 organic hydroperoxide resistance protein [Sphingomonas sp. Root720]
MATKILYTTSSTATGGRDGRARTADGSFEVTLGTPKELGGNGQGNNPEQLFASGYAACFLGAMKFVAAQGQHVQVPADATVTATVGIGLRADKGFGLAVALEISLPGVDRAAAEALVAEADTICPYSHAVRGNIEVKLGVA